ncbi:MAG: mismatch-specific glycosylase [Herbinix sp.]|jgi:hypoxanthine-DNA glycosylase|nr:mismatch-specific glycosylase [Herbinix sp.]
MDERIAHPFLPIYNEHSKVLILGTFPSVKSREGEFYYHHPQNRFWKVLSAIFDDKLPVSREEKIDFLLLHGVAVWDVIQSCEITGSADSSIRNVIPNDLELILHSSNINQIFANGETAYKLYMKYSYPRTGRTMIKLPSTSPANATFTLDKLLISWKQIKG